MAGETRPSPAEFHQLDLEAWPELVDLCFTYRMETRALFAERAVRTPATVDMYSPPPGRALVFHRYKRSHVARAGSTLALYQSMFDQVHGFELWYDVDTESHEIDRGPGADPAPPLHGDLRRAAAARAGHGRRQARRRLGGERAGRV